MCSRASIGSSCLAALFLASTTACQLTPPQSPASAPVLPLRTVRLYETGVGYFERSGSLEQPVPTTLPVPSGHLDDALKTLVVLDRGGKALVSGIEFPSSVSAGLARALASLPTEGDAPLGFQQLLAGMRGAAVEVVANGALHRGRLVDVVETTEDGIAVKAASGAAEAQADHADSKEAHTKKLTLLLVTGAGAIERWPAAQVDSVRPVDPGYASRLGTALDALSAQGARAERRLSVLSRGGPVTLGYVAEAPVWRTTYRIVLGNDGGGTLQGWALIHNDTDEDWRAVRVELANGRPDSFLFPLAAPRYARRSLVTPEDSLATVPQLIGTTVDAIWGEPEEVKGAGGLGVSGVGEGGGGSGSGFGIGHGGIAGSSSRTTSSDLLQVGNLAGIARASGTEAGALFVYSIPQPVDLGARASALVPFVSQAVDARPITWVDGPGEPARSAVRFVNSTTQTLPAGPIAFFADGGFSGESMLARLKPGERRYVTFGADLDLDLTTTQSKSVEEPKRLVYGKEGHVLREHAIRTSGFTYAIENRSGLPRAVFLAMSLENNATIDGPDEVDFDTESSRPVLVFRVDARKKVERRAHAVEGIQRSLSFQSLTAAKMTELASASTLPASDRAAANEAAARLREAEDAASANGKAQADEATVGKDIERLRDHMKALSGDGRAAGATNPFAARVLADEDRLQALRKKREELDALEKAKRRAAEAALAALSAS
jgi:hypothetical protein